MTFRERSKSAVGFGARRQWLALVLATVVFGIALACGGSSESIPSGSDAVQEPTGTLEQAAEDVSEVESSGSPDKTVPRFATKFSTPDEPIERAELKVVTLLPRDAIPSIDSPKFIDVESADEQMGDDDLVIGVAIDGEHKAYSTAFLSSHEIVNDVVGGKPVAVTW